jgi:AcrR family transcriptional regulator
MARQKSYHHGDLRQALIDTGLDMLEEQGLEGLTLRKLAARIGVSHAAPEHHFPTLRHLMTAFAVEGFKLFAASMREAMAAAADDPAEQLRGGLTRLSELRQVPPASLPPDVHRQPPRLGRPGHRPAGERRPCRARGDLVAGRKAHEAGYAEGRAAVEQLVWSQIHAMRI